MTIEAITGQIAAILAAADGEAVVHQYQRLATVKNDFVDLFKGSDDKIHAWTITRIKTASQKETSLTEFAHVFAVRGYYGLKDADATELVYQEIIEDVVAAFDNEDAETLNDSCLTINPDWGPMAGAIGLQVDVLEARMFFGVLCHFADCRLGVIER
ncbi:MAG: hypothetical protein SV375_00120 [Thermodesulfobacteriota bacterium]|nr:hypothetical protein [Thermodesulfobacteriota bacterium]